MRCACEDRPYQQIARCVHHKRHEEASYVVPRPTEDLGLCVVCAALYESMGYRVVPR